MYICLNQNLKGLEFTSLHLAEHILKLGGLLLGQLGITGTTVTEFSDFTSLALIANSINIMQVRVTRSRMAGDPPELLVTPRLADFALLDIDRAAEAIEEGRRALKQSLSSGT